MSVLGVVGGVLGALGGISNLVQTGYNIYTNERDFDYQKSVQQDVYNREDNAVQRRVLDLKAAGLNPNLAAGSAAGAGSVVGRSLTPNISGNAVGTALDIASHVQQLRAQRLQNEILNNQKDVSEFEKNTQILDSIFSRAALYKQLGFNDLQLRFSNGKPFLYSKDFNGNLTNLDLNDSPLMKTIDYQIQSNKNSADLLQKDVNWYTADKVSDYLGIGARIFGGVGTGLQSFGRWNKYYK